MHHLLTAAQVREAEAAAVAAGVPLSELMERAGAAVAVEVAAIAPYGPVAVVAGSGNNGGDGWVAARLLHGAGRRVHVLAMRGPESLPSPARAAAASAIAAGVPWELADDGDPADALMGASVVVDALLGIGASGAARPEAAALIEAMGRASAPIVAVDIPSGLDADSGRVDGASVTADATVTFIAPKPACVLPPASMHCGEVLVAEIGVPTEGVSGTDATLESWSADDYASQLPVPDWNAHKASRGRLLIVGGAPGLTGAPCLAAGAALRSGAGYVTVAVPAPSLPIVEMKLTSPVKVGLPADDGGRLVPEAVDAVLAAAARTDAVVLGPGLGRSPATIAAVRELVTRVNVPLLLDADALYALGDDLAPLDARSAPTVLTPHAGEAARLLGREASQVDADRIAAVRALARRGVTVVLKGPGTLVAGGGRVVVNPTGGPGLATLGTGDVLAGVIGSLLATGLEPLPAAVLGTYLHGAAGDIASHDLTPLCTTAEDVIERLSGAVASLGPTDRESHEEGRGTI